ncbi:MAG: hypothetical protein BWK76_28090 [Desulfobulbaceae bacterium A2]|nr:MAG: hypothetical protein BWK76_28090 [Desulfobulbaceae bacterium A2]
MKEQSGGEKSPCCRRCRHFFITHDPRSPHGCRVYGFKSAREPAEVVLQSSGLPCQLFQQRPRPTGADGDGDRYL